MTRKSSKQDPFRDRQGTRISGDAEQNTGAGAEAAEGIHAHPESRDDQREPSDTSALTDRPTGGGGDGTRRGSEPLADSRQSRSSYGGDAGSPKRPKDDGADATTGSEGGGDAGGGGRGGKAR